MSAADVDDRLAEVMNNLNTSDPDTVVPPALEFLSLAQVADEVRNSPLPAWLIRGLWTTEDYGMLGAEDKAGKTWVALDAAITVAAGLTFLNHWPVDDPGSVLVFVGEGSARKTMRRLYAVGAHYGLDTAAVDALPIRLCMRVPLLDNAQHLALIRAELRANPPKLAILDPLYLALGATDTANLASMGRVLGAIQYATQEVGTALMVVHHWNQTGSGTDRKRFSGAGSAEWGRVLASMSVLSRTTEDPEGVKRSVVDYKLEVIGDSVADGEATFRRRIWTDDPDDLGSPMHYEIERTILDPTQRAAATGSAYDKAKAAKASVVAVFTADPGASLSTRELYSAVRVAGHQHEDAAVRDAAGDLKAEGYLTIVDGPRRSRIHALAAPPLGEAS